MENERFKRGQVWFWEDPIYGQKCEGNEVEIGESVMRYTRTVVIIQSHPSSAGHGIICAPLSSKNHDPNDIKCSVLANLYMNEGISYIKMNKIFVAHPKMLVKYVTTLDTKIMRAVEGRIVNMLLPSIMESTLVPLDKFSSWYGIDVSEKQISDEVLGVNKSVDVSELTNFVNSYIYRTDVKNDKLKIIDIMRAYRTYCISNDIKAIDDPVEFSVLLSKVLLINTDWIIGNETRIRDTSISGVIIRGLNSLPDGITIEKSIDIQNNQKIEDPVSTHDVKDDKPTKQNQPQPRSKWNDETKARFVKQYHDNPVQALVDFNIKDSTASLYYKKWKNSYPCVSESENEVVSTNHQESMDVEKIKESITNEQESYRSVTTVNTMRLAISSFANGIRDDILRNNHAWEKVYIKHEYETGKITSSADWYNTISSVIYNSLFTYFGLRKMEMTDVIQDYFLSEGNSMHFVLSLYNGLGTSIGTFQKKVEKYKNKYNVTDCMADDWLAMLSQSLMTMINVDNEGSDIIYDMIINAL